MIFSAADIPIDLPSPFGGLFEYIQTIEPASQQVSQAQLDSLASKVDKAIAVAHSFVDMILEYDLKWRTSVFRGETEYNEAIENRIRSSLKSWADDVERLLLPISSLQEFGFNPASLGTLHPRLAEVRSMLTPDDEFFVGEEFDKLTAQALGEDERGLTVEFREMGE